MDVMIKLVMWFIPGPMGLFDIIANNDGQADAAEAIDQIETRDDICRYLGIDAPVGSDQYWDRIAAAGFAASKEWFEDAYADHGSDEKAISYLEEMAVPALQQRLDDVDAPRPDAVEWVGQLHDAFGDDFEPDPSFHYNVGAEEIDTLYHYVRSEYEADSFDTIVGVYSSGLPFMYAAAGHLDADPVVLRYSCYTRDDDGVMITPTMADRQAFTDTDVLIIDDITYSGETLETVGTYVLDQEPAHIEALIGEDQTRYEFESNEDGTVTVEEIDRFSGWRSMFDILS